MRSKTPKNKKNKLHIKFDEGERRDYLLGFRKRKLERKAKAKKEMEERFKKEKREIKIKRMELIKKMLEERVSQFSDESDEEDPLENCKSSEKEKNVTEYDNCTVEVSDLNLENKSFLGTKTKNKDKTKKPSNSQDESKGKESFSFKIPFAKAVANNRSKTSLWKSASKIAKKTFESEKRFRRKKKKVLVTEL